jgi:hypothetical protein
VTITAVLSFMAHRSVVSNLLKKTGEILTHAGDYVENSDPATLKEIFVDAKDVLSLVQTLEVAAKYNGVTTKAPAGAGSAPTQFNSMGHPVVTTPNQ